MTRFVVDLGKAEIPEHKKQAIAASIQASVIQHLADHETPGERQLGYIPIWWRGYVLRETIQQLELAEKQIGAFANNVIRAE